MPYGSSGPLFRLTPDAGGTVAPCLRGAFAVDLVSANSLKVSSWPLAFPSAPRATIKDGPVVGEDRSGHTSVFARLLEVRTIQSPWYLPLVIGEEEDGGLRRLFLDCAAPRIPSVAWINHAVKKVANSLNFMLIFPSQFHQQLV